GVGWAGLALGTRRIQAKIIENERIQADLNTKKNNLSLFRSLIDQANDSLFIVDPDTSRLLDINERAAHVLGFKQRHLLTKSVMDIDPTFPDIQAWNAHVQEMKNREQMTINSHHRCQDGTLMPVEVTLRYLTHDQQDFIIASSRDITERKLKEIELEQYQTQLETMVEERTAELRGKTVDLEMSQQELESANLKLQELDRLKSMFIASMSHELRTPLNSIIGFSSILLEEWPGPLNPEQRTNQAIILNNGRHLLSLINDIIDISKIEAGMLESQDMEFDLDELIAETTINFSQEAHNKGISLNTNPCACRLLTDRRRLLQCLINLVSNAVKFTEHGMVSVYAKKLADSRIAISVNDTGIGISTEDQARLFTPFLRLEPSNNKYPGTGLGLYLSHKLANEVLQGDLTVVSALNQGSTFTLIIPTRRARGEVVKKISNYPPSDPE
ncbi:MAG: ATP-binding protein, partial [Desulfobulbaceae bacterium]|nr:ATP-binding protein [Desulfobulbaceae bacterium]